MYPSGSVKITMQLDAAGGKTQEFILHWPLFIFCSILPCNPFTVSLTGKSLEALLHIINDGSYKDLNYINNHVLYSSKDFKRPVVLLIKYPGLKGIM